VLSFPKLQPLIQVCFEFLLEGIHLILLLLNKLRLMSNNLLTSLLHVFLSLLCLKFLASDLNLMCFLILLLLRQTLLNLLHIEELGAELEGEGELVA